MKKVIHSIIVILFIVAIFSSCDDDNIFHTKVKTVNAITTVSGIRPGGLDKALFLRLRFVTKLQINDTIDSRDFQTMRDKMPNLTEIDLTNVTIAAYNGFDGSGGERIYRYQANKIPDFAFYNPETSVENSKLSSLKLPQNITSIGNYAFNRCTALSGVLEIPLSVKDTIGKSAFSFCESITGLKLSGVNYIGESAFQNCYLLTGDIEFPDSVFKIDSWAFANCDYVNSFTLSKTVDEIEIAAFSGCNADFTVNIDNQSFSAKDGVLFNADQTTLIQFQKYKSGNYEIPSTVNVIGSYAFANCIGLASVTFPASTNMIEDYAFSGCTGLIGDFPISSGLSGMGQYVFENCSNISGFQISSDNTTYTFVDGLLIEYQLFVKRYIESKTGNCVIPADILVIDNSAFSNCKNLSSVTIPASVITIGQRAFYNCIGLTNINVASTEPIDMSFTATAFEEINFKNCTLNVPSGTIDAYRSAEVWKVFYSIVETQ
ncbi:MAG: leucine-rich repeat domain-containing protein [Paludibacter sp.]|nr:leucine-rich repeat domain-containing protein [Paludibacter sp.]